MNTYQNIVADSTIIARYIDFVKRFNNNIGDFEQNNCALLPAFFREKFYLTNAEKSSIIIEVKEYLKCVEGEQDLALLFQRAVGRCKTAVGREITRPRAERANAFATSD